MNWGNKLLVTFLVFGAGMSYLVYRSVTTEFELVDKDYYKNELRYQEVIDGVKHANALGEVAQLSPDGQGLQLQLPKEMKGQVISGTLQLYCDYDSKRDRKFTLNTDTEGTQWFSKDHLVPGRFVAKLSWKANGIEYYTEQPVIIR